MSAPVCTRVREGVKGRGQLCICEPWAFISHTIFKLSRFYFIDLNIILIYPHISSDNSIYWCFRHLRACGRLINLLVCFECLYPGSLFFFFFKASYMAGSEDDTKSHHSFIITLSFLYHWIWRCFFPSSPYRTTSGLVTERRYGQADKAEDYRREEMWLPGSCMSSHLLHSPSNSMGI